MELKVCNRSSLVDITVFPNLTPLLVFETRVRDLWLGFGSRHPICQTTYHHDYWMEYSNLFIDNAPWKRSDVSEFFEDIGDVFSEKERSVGIFSAVNSFINSFLFPKLCIQNKVNPKICRTLLINFSLKFDLVDISCDCAIILHIQRTRQAFSIGITKTGLWHFNNLNRQYEWKRRIQNSEISCVKI